MQHSQVAAITSSIGQFCKDPSGIADSLKKIRGIGYEAVQISGIGPIEPAELKRITDDLGLTICATHEKNTMIVHDPQAVIDKLGVLGVKYTAYPYPHVMPTTPEGLAEVVAALDASVAMLREAGRALAYHNHDIEFLRMDGKPALEWIYERTSPENLLGEPDTHWIQRGGGDVVAWCERLAGRLPILHMKDYAIDEDRKPLMTSIGSGNLDWNRICAAATASGCEWWVVEHDGGTFESLAASYAYIVENLVD